MEALLSLARKHASQAEVWQTSTELREVVFQDAKLARVETSLQEGVSLRVIKDGRIGSAYTTNLRDPAGLVRQAMESARFGGEAPAGLLPATRLPAISGPGVDSVRKFDTAAMAEEAERFISGASARTGGTVNVHARANLARTRLLNSSGADLSATTSNWDFQPRLLFDGSCAGVGERVFADGFEPFRDEDLGFACHLYHASKRTAVVGTCRMPVIFMPEAAFLFHWRLMSAADATSLYQKMSPYEGKIGQKVASDLITFVDDPARPDHPRGQPFDDEGSPAIPLTIIDKGVFRGFFTDLLHAQKLGLAANGRCFRGAGYFGADKVSVLPRPWLPQPAIAAGMTPFSAMLAEPGRALVVFDILGGHSGNIPNGDFSIGISTGFLVERGEITGRVKDVLLTGNIHDLLRRVRLVGNRVGPSFCGFAPPLLFDDVSVTGSGGRF